MGFYWWSATLSQISSKFAFGIFFNALGIAQSRGRKVSKMAAILKRYTLFNVFFLSQIIMIWCTLSMVYFLSENFTWKVVFWGWVNRDTPSLAPTDGKYLSHLYLSHLSLFVKNKNKNEIFNKLSTPSSVESVLSVWN